MGWFAQSWSALQIQKKKHAHQISTHKKIRHYGFPLTSRFVQEYIGANVSKFESAVRS